MAARVAAVPRPKARQRVSFGLLASAAAFVMLVTAMFCLAPHTQPGFGSLAFNIELLLLIQMLVLLAWVTLRRRT